MSAAILLPPLLLAAALGLGGAWLTGTESGLQASAHLAENLSDGRLKIDAPRGQLAGPLTLSTLHWRSPGFEIKAEDIRFDWSPSRLLERRLEIAELRIGTLQLNSPSDSSPTAVPQAFRLPLAVNGKKLAISKMTYNDGFVAESISGRFDSDGERHKLSDFSARIGDIALDGEAELLGRAPLPLVASARLRGQLEQRPVVLALAAEGPIDRLKLSAKGESGIDGQGEVELTLFAPALFSQARIALSNIDPAAWQQGAPAARLSLNAELSPQGAGVAGRVSITNHQPGPLDHDRLPLRSLSGRLDWQHDRTSFDKLQAALSGGELAGRGHWQDGALSLDLTASNLDVASLHSTLHTTRLDGSLSARLAGASQTIKLALADSRFSLNGEVTHAAERIDIPALTVSAGTARAMLKGQLALGGNKAFAASGELQDFDPSRFTRVAAARINARFNADGKLAPRPLIDGRFELLDSQLAGQPLSGQGKLQIDGATVPLVDIQLRAGPNRLDARGAFGLPGDRLTLDIAAPQLAGFGLNGDLSGQIRAFGSLERPVVDARLAAGSLGRSGVGRLKKMDLQAWFGRQPDSPLKVQLGVGQLDLPARTQVASDLNLVVDGSQQTHRLHGRMTLADHTQISLSASGGLQGLLEAPSWVGRLEQALIQGPDKDRTIRLSEPAPLELAAGRWRLGPARLAGDTLDWQARLLASAGSDKLELSLGATGSRIGRLDGQLVAAMNGAWRLSSQAPWQGSVRLDSPDLAWLGDLLGESWETSGRFNGEIRLAGTPADPVTSGQLRGEKLGLVMRDQGMRLANGDLAIELDNNLLRIHSLNFDSLLQTLPRPLRLGAREDLSGLTAKPGRLEISGEMRVDRNAGADQAFLDYRLERFGVWQLPEQWVAISGSGRLSLHGNAFGARGQLAVDAGYWRLPKRSGPRLSDDVVIRRAGESRQDNDQRPNLDLDISTELGRNVLFSGIGLDSRLTGDIRLRANGRDLPRATGSIRTRDGRFDAYGQQLSIERGVLSFQGLLDNPALDIKAVRKGLSVEPGVLISGNVKKPVIRLISDPDLPDTEKLAWLILGHGSDQMSAGDATVLFGAAGGLLGNDSSKLLGTLKRTFNVDEFGIRQGDLGATGGRQQTSRVAGSSVDTTGGTGSQILSIGKRLSSNALLSYEQSLGKAEGIVKLTVNLTRQISLIGRAGSDNALDIFYTITFGRAPRKPR